MANSTPSGNPNPTAIDASIMFNKNPPQRVGLGLSPTSSIENIKGKSSIHKVTRKFLYLFSCTLVVIKKPNRYEVPHIIKVAETRVIFDEVVNIADTAITAALINKRSFLDGNDQVRIDENTKKQANHKIAQTLHSCSGGILPIKRRRLLTLITSHSALAANPIKLIVK